MLRVFCATWYRLNEGGHRESGAPPNAGRDRHGANLCRWLPAAGLCCKQSRRDETEDRPTVSPRPLAGVATPQLGSRNLDVSRANSDVEEKRSSYFSDDAVYFCGSVGVEHKIWSFQMCRYAVDHLEHALRHVDEFDVEEANIAWQSTMASITRVLDLDARYEERAGAGLN